MKKINYVEYEKHLQKVKDAVAGNEKFKGKIGSELACPGIIVGKEYFADRNRTFMLVGRALNGWDKNQDTPINDFEWLIKKGIKYSETRPQNTNWHNKSSFWRCTKIICDKLFGFETSNVCDDEYAYLKHIAWSNLYKIAPKSGGNPNNKLCRVQLTPCIELLSYEIEILKPHYIWFDTGCDWTHEFVDYGCDNFTKNMVDKPSNIFTLLHGVKDSGKWKECTKSKNANVLATRGIIWEDDETTKMVISKRSEYKKEDAFTAEILSCFGIK
jgi:hypothetical protein